MGRHQLGDSPGTAHFPRRHVVSTLASRVQVVTYYTLRTIIVLCVDKMGGPRVRTPTIFGERFF